MATDYKAFYSDELRRLRQHSQEFARDNPAIAPLLGSPAVDPDIERLLEGVAFLNAHTRQKLDDEFPEIAQELASILMPQMLRPVPAATMVVFEPKSPDDHLLVKAGSELASIPLDGVRCRFQTIADLSIEPTRLLSAKWDKSASGQVVLKLELSAVETSKGNTLPNHLRFFLGDDVEAAATLLMLLDYHLDAVALLDGRGGRFDLRENLSFPGFEETLVEQPVNSLPSFGLLRELLFFPEKFLFVEVHGLAKLPVVLASNRFVVEFCLKKGAQPIPDLSVSSLMLNVVPAVNVFRTSAEPINVTHETADYLVLPDGKAQEHYQIFSIDSVIGLRQGQREEKRYLPFSWVQFGEDRQTPTYRTSVRQSMSGQWAETYLTLIYGRDQVPVSETLSIELTCTNRWLPERLKLGEVNAATNSSPERCSFRNITPVKGSVDAPSQDSLVWGAIGHVALNFMSLGSTETVHSLLRLYNSFKTNDHAVRSANQRQIEGIRHVEVSPETRLHRGVLIRGQVVKMVCDQSHWGSTGSMYLWGCVLARFLAQYASINTYTRVEMRDTNTGAEFKWTPMLGSKLSI